MAEIFIPKELIDGETRVAAVPETIKRYIKAGATVKVQQDAGTKSFISNKEFTEAGAEIITDAKTAYASADMVLKVRQPVKNSDLGADETDLMKEGTLLITTLSPFNNPDVVKKLIDKKISSISMDFIPRISRAQKMDSLSSQSNIAGYKAVLMAATELPKYFPMLMTAAGTIKPAKVVIIGAGVAGLQAIATARRLGANVEVSDVRPAVKEQVESLGAKYIEVQSDEKTEGEGGYAKEVSAAFLKKQKELLHQHISAADVVICTALVPGKKAPVIVGAEMVKSMKPGSVIVDLAVEQGGNCELSSPGVDVVVYGIKILGRLNVPASVPLHASETYSKNIMNLVLDMLKDGKITIDMEDEVVAGSIITHEGKLMQDRLKETLGE